MKTAPFDFSKAKQGHRLATVNGNIVTNISIIGGKATGQIRVILDNGEKGFIYDSNGKLVNNENFNNLVLLIDDEEKNPREIPLLKDAPEVSPALLPPTQTPIKCEHGTILYGSCFQCARDIEKFNSRPPPKPPFGRSKGQ